MIPINQQFVAAVLLSIIGIVVTLGGALSDDWGNGSALLGGSEDFSAVKLGLWYGVSRSTSKATTNTANTFYYGWCEANSDTYEASYCFDLQAARVGACAGINLMVATLVIAALLSTYVVKMRLEPVMARVSAIFSGAAAGCFLMCVAVWARLILDLSKTGGTSRAQLSIGMSWLAEAGGFVVAFLTTLNLIFAARRVDQEIAELNAAAAPPARRKSADIGGHKEQPSAPTKPHRDGRVCHPSADAEIGGIGIADPVGGRHR